MDAALMSLELHGRGSHVVVGGRPGAAGRQQWPQEPADIARAPEITASSRATLPAPTPRRHIYGYSSAGMAS